MLRSRAGPNTSSVLHIFFGRPRSRVLSSKQTVCNVSFIVTYSCPTLCTVITFQDDMKFTAYSALHNKSLKEEGALTVAKGP
jgi:hypothetical protein